MRVIYGSVCSGIEAATVAWHPLGWEPAWFSEIEKFPSAVLAHHYPDVPNLGDMTKLHETEAFRERPIQLLVGGTPCQSFSVAGLRKGLADPRGNLALVFLALIDRTRPRWVVWENVPGVLSSAEGRDFGSFLGGLVQLGYGFAYRVLDAQYFGVPQRRRRVFVVGYLGDWRPATAVLFERSCLSGNPAPSREAWQRTAQTISSRASYDRGDGSEPIVFEDQGGSVMNISTDGQVGTLRRETHGHEPIIFEPRSQDGVPRVSEGISPTLNTAGVGQRQPCVSVNPGWSEGEALGFNNRQDPCPSGHVTNPIGAKDNGMGVAFEPGSISRHAGPAGEQETVSTLRAEMGDNQPAVRIGMQVRRITPRECERLQGFPDDYTLIPYRGKPSADGPRYKALGNSMAVPVMAWIGRRIQMVEMLGER